MSFGTLLLLLSIVINLIAFPVAYFIGGMGTDSATNDVEMWQGFLFGFLFIQGIPLLMLITSIVILIFRKKVKSKLSDK